MVVAVLGELCIRAGAGISVYVCCRVDRQGAGMTAFVLYDIKILGLACLSIARGRGDRHGWRIYYPLAGVDCDLFVWRWSPRCPFYANTRDTNAFIS